MYPWLCQLCYMVYFKWLSSCCASSPVYRSTGAGRRGHASQLHWEGRHHLWHAGGHYSVCEADLRGDAGGNGGSQDRTEFCDAQRISLKWDVLCYDWVLLEAVLISLCFNAERLSSLCIMQAIEGLLFFCLWLFSVQLISFWFSTTLLVLIFTFSFTSAFSSLHPKVLQSRTGPNLPLLQWFSQGLKWEQMHLQPPPQPTSACCFSTSLYLWARIYPNVTPTHLQWYTDAWAPWTLEHPGPKTCSVHFQGKLGPHFLQRTVPLIVTCLMVDFNILVKKCGSK